MVEENSVILNQEFKQRLLKIIKDASRGTLKTQADAVIFYHWLKNQTMSYYAFVPKKYRTRF